MSNTNISFTDCVGLLPGREFAKLQDAWFPTLSGPLAVVLLILFIDMAHDLSSFVPRTVVDF